MDPKYDPINVTLDSFDYTGWLKKELILAAFFFLNPTKKLG